MIALPAAVGLVERLPAKNSCAATSGNSPWLSPRRSAEAVRLFLDGGFTVQAPSRFRRNLNSAGHHATTKIAPPSSAANAIRGRRKSRHLASPITTAPQNQLGF